MTAFVILAGGRGTRMSRVGESIHKCLVPLGGRALLSHQFDLAPKDARIIVVVKDRAEQIIEYVQLAHPDQPYVEFVRQGDIPGPGGALMSAAELIGMDDFVVAACDTLWHHDASLWQSSLSWMGVSAIPAGTTPQRWCRVGVGAQRYIGAIVDKQWGELHNEAAFIGLGYIARQDADTFWRGLETGTTIHNELQLSSGFKAVLKHATVEAQHISWIDVGDEAAYRQAVALFSGYDWTKYDQATYVLPETGRVVKYSRDYQVTEQRVARGRALGKVVPQPIMHGTEMMAYPFVSGKTMYDALQAQGGGLTLRLLDWYESTFWKSQRTTSDSRHPQAQAACFEFYHNKTIKRIEMLKPELRLRASDIIARVPWEELCDRPVMGLFHGDFAFGNIIVQEEGKTFYGIDWREWFTDDVGLDGDLRYDLAKMIMSTIVHWDNARRGDFRPWPEAEFHRKLIMRWIWTHAGSITNVKMIEVIAGLSLLNSAPLHAEPLDEICVARGVAWLEDLL